MNPLPEGTRQRIQEHETVAIGVTSRFLGRVGLDYLQQRLDYDVSSEFGNFRLLVALWLTVYQGDRVRLVELYEGLYRDRSEPRNEPLLELFLISLAANILAGIAVEEYRRHRGRVRYAVRSLAKECRLALRYLFDKHALHYLLVRRVINPEEYDGLLHRLQDNMRRGRRTLRTLRDRLRPYYGELGVSSSDELLDAFESFVATQRKSPVQFEYRPRAGTVRGRVLLKGVPAYPGVVEGAVRVVRGVDDFKRIRSGAIAALYIFTPEMVPEIRKCSALIGMVGHSRFDPGGITGHLAIVARALGIPTVVLVEDPSMVLRSAERIVLDAHTGEIRLTKRRSSARPRKER